MSRNQITAIVICSMALLVTWFAFFRTEQPPESIATRIYLFERPQEIDRSLIDELSVQINGVDALNGHPTAVAGEEMHITGLLVKKPDALTYEQHMRLTMAHREIVDGEADWASVPDEFDERSISPAYPGDVIDSHKKVRLEPGEYELRFYGLVDSSNPEYGLPVVYHLARGRLTVLPPDATSDEGRSSDGEDAS